MFDKDDIKNDLFKVLFDKPHLIITIKKKYLNDDLWKFCIEREPSVFKYKQDPSPDLCHYAVCIDGTNIEYVPKHVINAQICYLAVKNNPKAILYVPKKYNTDELREIAFDLDPCLMKNYNVREAYMIDKVRENPAIIKYIKNPPEHLICEAIKIDSNIILYFDFLTDRMLDVIDEYYPDIAETFPNYRNRY